MHSQRPPRYDALWHLKKPNGIGVFERAKAGFQNPEKIEQQRIVLIDNSVDVDHPLLINAINQDLSIDFTSHRLGVFLRKKSAGRKGQIGKLPSENPFACEQEDFFERIRAEHAPTEHTFNDKPEGTKVKPAVMREFSAHGTSCAGLIAARPTTFGNLYSALHKTPSTFGEDGDADACPSISPDQSNGATDEGAEARPLVLPDQFASTGIFYMGADPTCELVVISTNFDVDPEQMLFALSYATWLDPSVIVLPRDIPNPYVEIGKVKNTDTYVFNDGNKKPLNIQPDDRRAFRPEEKELWREVHDFLQHISVPLFCAAGNTASEFPIYPAGMMKEVKNIYAVGAHTYNKPAASYSPIDVSFRAPSGDGEAYDSGQRLLNVNDPDFDIQAFGKASDNIASIRTSAGLDSNAAFDPIDVISIDVLGQYGYNPGPMPFVYHLTDKAAVTEDFDDQAMEELRQQKEDLENQQTDGSTDNQNNSADMTQKMRKQEALDGGYRFEFGSMFTPFSGTSAAVCIAAGAYTTLLANGKKPKKAIKKIINRKSRN